MSAPLVVVSNRGPVSFSIDADDRLVARRGAGGLVSSLAPLIEGMDVVWITAAMTDGDRVAAHGRAIATEGFRHRILAVDPAIYRMAYDIVANATLWFLAHQLFDLSRRPRIDERWREAWQAYRAYNDVFADAIAEEASNGATVLVQDYHLWLAGSRLAALRPDLHTVHFTHIPFFAPSELRVLPAEIVEELLGAMSSYGACGFQAQRWAAAFRACCNEILGSTPPTFVSSLAPHHDEIAAVAASEACLQAGTVLADQIADAALVLRVDRIEPSKNLLRGFWAFDELLRRHRHWIGRVVFAAYVYPSREALPEYLAYRHEAEAAVAEINRRWATPDWTPILLDTSDDFPASVAALERYDVLLVNSLRDGLNLVAKEGPLLNERDGVLALSREAGVWEELGGTDATAGALALNPFDVSGTADVLDVALSMPPDQRALHASALRTAVASRSPRAWLDDQLRAAGRRTASITDT